MRLLSSCDLRESIRWSLLSLPSSPLTHILHFSPPPLLLPHTHTSLLTPSPPLTHISLLTPSPPPLLSHTQNYTRMRTQALQDDLANIDVSLPEERKYLEHEVLKVRRSPPNYFRSPWNIIDIVTFVIMLVIIILHIVDVITHSEQLALWTARYGSWGGGGVTC